MKLEIEVVEGNEGKRTIKFLVGNLNGTSDNLDDETVYRVAL